MGVTENIEERLSFVLSLVGSSAFYEERQEGYSELSTIKKNNFFVLPVCLSEIERFDAGNFNVLSAWVIEMTGFFVSE